jgi:hypothetical protein
MKLCSTPYLSLSTYSSSLMTRILTLIDLQPLRLPSRPSVVFANKFTSPFSKFAQRNGHHRIGYIAWVLGRRPSSVQPTLDFGLLSSLQLIPKLREEMLARYFFLRGTFFWRRFVVKHAGVASQRSQTTCWHQVLVQTRH